MKTYKNVLVLVIAATVAASASGSVFAADYSVDPSHSHVGFTVRHIVSRVSGEFKSFEGKFKFDEGNAAESNVEFTAKSASISTDEPKRDTHLKSADFLDAAKFPTLKFVSHKISASGDKKYEVEGDLTIHGVTKTVTFAVEYLGEAKDPWGGTRAGFTSLAKINRKDFGMIWNKALDAGGVVLGDEVQIAVDVEGVKK